jgi:hypothetical protein
VTAIEPHTCHSFGNDRTPLPSPTYAYTHRRLAILPTCPYSRIYFTCRGFRLSISETVLVESTQVAYGYDMARVPSALAHAPSSLVQCHPRCLYPLLYSGMSLISPEMSLTPSRLGPTFSHSHSSTLMTANCVILIRSLCRSICSLSTIPAISHILLIFSFVITFVLKKILAVCLEIVIYHHGTRENTTFSGPAFYQSYRYSFISHFGFHLIDNKVVTRAWRPWKFSSERSFAHVFGSTVIRYNSPSGHDKALICRVGSLGIFRRPSGLLGNFLAFLTFRHPPSVRKHRLSHADQQGSVSILPPGPARSAYAYTLYYRTRSNFQYAKDDYHVLASRKHKRVTDYKSYAPVYCLWIIIPNPIT